MDILEWIGRIGFAVAGYGAALAQRWIAERPSLEWEPQHHDGASVLAHGELTIRNRAPRKLYVETIEIVDDTLQLVGERGQYFLTTNGRKIPMPMEIDAHGTAQSSQDNCWITVMLPPGVAASKRMPSLPSTRTLVVRFRWTDALFFGFANRRIARRLRIKIDHGSGAAR